MNCLDPGHAALFADTFPVMALSLPAPTVLTVRPSARNPKAAAGRTKFDHFIKGPLEKCEFE
jgi:hypothetical protein